ncbi:hypothetical protein T484DRAFT_3642044, partial [Baffinella frigidus]
MTSVSFVRRLGYASRIPGLFVIYARNLNGEQWIPVYEHLNKVSDDTIIPVNLGGICYLQYGIVVQELLETTGDALNFVRWKVMGEYDVTTKRLYPPTSSAVWTNQDHVQRFDWTNVDSVERVATFSQTGQDYGNGEYTVRASSTYYDDDLHLPWRVFVDQPDEHSSLWRRNAYDAGVYIGEDSLDGSYKGDWVTIKHPAPFVMKECQFVMRNNRPGLMPGKFKIYGRNNDVDLWTPLYTQSEDPSGFATDAIYSMDGYVPIPGLVMHMPFDTNFVDSMGHYTATIDTGTGKYSFGTPGEIGTGYAIVSVTDGYSIQPALDAISLLGSGCTIAIWVKFDAFTGDHKAIWFLDAIDSTGVAVGTVKAYMGFRGLAVMHTRREVDYKYSAAVVPTSTWVHVTVVVARSTSTNHDIHWYIDGVKIATMSNADFRDFHTWRLYVAKDPRSGVSALNGTLDDLRIYNYDLSATEVAAMYSARYMLPPYTEYGVVVNQLRGSEEPVWYDDNFMNFISIKMWGTPVASVETSNVAAFNAVNPIASLYGVSDTQLTWPAPLAATFTVCWATRFHSATSTNKRLLQCVGSNCIFGHNSRGRGWLLADGWYKDEYLSGPDTDWLIACTTNGRADASNYIIDQTDWGSGHAGGSPGTLGVNTYDNDGDFNIHSVYVWDNELSNTEMKVVTRALRKELGGVPDLSPDGTTAVLSISDLRAYYLRFLLATRPAQSINIFADLDGVTVQDRVAGLFPVSVTTGTATKVSTTGLSNGANNSIIVLQGTSDTKLLWPMYSIPKEVTICSVSRYTGEEMGRILTCWNSPDQSANFLHGHHGGRRGYAYYNGWTADEVSVGVLTDWLVMCGTSGGVAPNNLIVDQFGVGLNSIPTNKAGQLMVNYGGEFSDFAVHSVYVWNAVLSATDMRH